MRRIKAIIEKADDDGISVYSEDVAGAYGYGLTENEAREDFAAVLEEQAEYYKELHGSLPAWKARGYTVDYFYDMSGFYEAFPFINASKLAKVMGINESMMRKYKGRIVTPSCKQKALIQRKYDEIVRRMQRVRF